MASKKFSRRDLIKTGSAAGLSAILLPADAALAQGSISFIKSTDEYEIYKINGSYTQGNITMSYRSNDGDTELMYYSTKNESNSKTYLNSDLPSIGVNPHMRNGYMIRASPGKPDGYLYLKFGVKALIGGFYSGSNPNSGLIHRGEEVKVGITKGEVSCLKAPQYKPPFPIMDWDFDGTGMVSTGNVLIKVDRGRIVKIDENSEPVSGATPMYVRTKRDKQPVFISANGKVLKADQIVGQR